MDKSTKEEKSLIAPITKVVNTHVLPSFRAASKQVAQNSQPQKTVDETKKNKKKVSWGKLIGGVAIAYGAIEFVLRRNPTKRLQKKAYTELFSQSVGDVERHFPMIPYRDELIIMEAANGNTMARQRFNTLSKGVNGEGILEYIQAYRRVERASQNFIEGRFDNFHRKNSSVEQSQNIFFESLEATKIRAEELYRKHLQPHIKN